MITCSPRWRVATTLATLLASAPAQSFLYQDFQAAAGLNLIGDATITADRLRLTANTPNQTSHVWRTASITAEHGFSTTFGFRLVPSAIGTKGEGFAFVVHASPAGNNARGGTAWALGYGLGANGTAIGSGIAIEIDTYRDQFLGDTSDNELSIHVRGGPDDWEHENYSVARTTPTTNLADGNVHTLRIEYTSGLLEVYLDGSAQPVLATTYDLFNGGQYLTGFNAFNALVPNIPTVCGFTATTGAGALTELCEITSWQWTSGTDAHPCVLGSLGEDVLFVEGQTGGGSRELELGVAQGLTIDVVPPAGFGPGAPYVLFGSLTQFAPAPGSPGTQLGFGETCFPVLPTSPSELVLLDTLGIFGGLLPGAPAPFTLTIPPGVVTSPLELTLQAVIASSANPLQFGVSNAIALDFVPPPAPIVTGIFPSSALPGQPIRIDGDNFLTGLTVQVAGVPVAVTSVSSDEIVFPFPAATPCDAALQVVNPDGQAAATTLNRSPTITTTVLSSGSTLGGSTFVIIGNGFAEPMTVTIGGNPAAINVSTSASISVTTPPGTQGVQPVVVTTPGGCSAMTTYTYL